MPVTGVMADKTKIPGPLSLASTPARSTRSTASSIPSYTLRTTTSSISTNKASTPRIVKPPTPTTPGEAPSMRDQVVGKPTTASSSTSAGPPATAADRAERIKQRTVRDVGTSSSSTVTSSPRTPKVYPKSISVTRESTPSRPSQNKSPAALNANNTDPTSRGPGNPKASDSGSGPTSARVRTSVANGRTSTATKTESGASDAGAETDTSNYTTPPSSPDAAFRPTAGVVNGRAVAPKRSGDVGDKSAAQPSTATSTATTTTTSTSATTSSSAPASLRSSSRKAPPSVGPSSPQAAPTLPILPNGGTGNEGTSEAVLLSSMLHGRNECEILRAFAMPDKAIQTLKGIVYGGDPAHLRGMSEREIDTLKRALALYDFYWFTKDLDADVMTAFVDKVTYTDMNEIAEDEGYATEDEASPVAVFNDGQVVKDGQIVNIPSRNGIAGLHSRQPSLASSAPAFLPSTDDDEIPSIEARVDPRVVFLDPQERQLRALGRRCASGAALLAAAKLALQEEEHAHGKEDANGKEEA